MSYVLHLECSSCGNKQDHRQLIGVCPRCASPLLVRYDLDKISSPDVTIRTDLPGLWRYLELLPVEQLEEAINLGEGWTPLIRAGNLERRLNGPEVYIKDESVNPTGSFKARGLSLAVTMAVQRGADKLCIPSAGNAGGALAAYGAHAGVETYVFVPRDTPIANIVEAQMTATRVALVEGVITDAARAMRAEASCAGWFDVSTLKEPYRIEGKKTLGYELFEQFEWQLPTVILYPTGGGTGLIGMWKAFEEMEKLGWIDSTRPRMVAVQSSGCAPIVRAFEEGLDRAPSWDDPRTIASGIRVPQALGDFLILDALRKSDGKAVAVSDQEIFAAIKEIGLSEGIFCCPEGAACWAALARLRDEGWVEAEDRVVIFNTGAGTKYVDVIDRFAAAWPT